MSKNDQGIELLNLAKLTVNNLRKFNWNLKASGKYYIGIIGIKYNS